MTGEGYAAEGEVLKDGKPAGEDPVLKLVGRVCMLCNDAELLRDEDGWKVEGDPTEGALYPFASKIGLERQAEQTAYPRINAIPFESEHRFMATLHRDAAGKELLLVKGAPEAFSSIAIGSRPPAGTRRSTSTISRQASDRLAAQGERVLALAWLEQPGLQRGQPRAGGSAEGTWSCSA